MDRDHGIRCGPPVNDALATLTIVLALAVAAWALIAALRDRPPGWSQLIGLAAVEIAILALAVATGISVLGGEGPGDAATFSGYLISTVCLPVLAGVLARMEPTRWGSVTVMVFCLVIPVLVVRLQQTWSGAGG